MIKLFSNSAVKFLFSAMLMVSSLITVQSLYAASNVTFSLDPASLTGQCAAGEYVLVNYSGAYDATTNDGDGNDWLAIVAMDGDGNPYDNDWSYASVGSAGVPFTDFTTAILNPTARPMIVRVYDIHSSGAAIDENSPEGMALALTGTLIAEQSIDFRNLPGCSELPLRGVSVAVPTLSEWGIIIFIMLAGLGSILYLRKQRKA